MKEKLEVAAPLAIDSAVCALIGLPMCTSREDAQRELGGFFKERFEGSLKANGNGASKAFFDDVLASIWSGSRQYAMARDLCSRSLDDAYRDYRTFETRLRGGQKAAFSSTRRLALAAAIGLVPASMVMVWLSRTWLAHERSVSGVVGIGDRLFYLWLPVAAVFVIVFLIASVFSPVDSLDRWRLTRARSRLDKRLVAQWNVIESEFKRVLGKAVQGICDVYKRHGYECDGSEELVERYFYFVKIGMPTQ